MDLADSAAMLTRREASTPRPSPRCTCLPPRQHCAEVALGASTTDSAAMLTQREASTPRPSPRRTCLPPRQHCVEVALGGKQVHLGCASVYLLSSSCNFNSSTRRPSSSPTRLRLVGLELGLGVLERSQWWAPRATSAQVPLVKSKSNSASPRWTWT